MRVCVSSIAWKQEQASDVAGILRNNGAYGVEASPGLFAVPLSELSAAQIGRIRSFWEHAGLPLAAMQSLLFNGPQVNLFGTKAERGTMAEYLKTVIGVAARLGCGPLVFGSPKNRLRGDRSPEEAFDMAGTFFYDLAETAEAEGCVVCIEPNAEAYGCDFATRHEEAVKLARAVNRKGVGFNIDTGVMRMNGETVPELRRILRDNGAMPAHVHISEPFLAPVSAPERAFHLELRSLLDFAGYQGVVSIEMKAPPQAADVHRQLETALREVKGLYGE